jgi:hypothetical protein
LAHSKSRPVEQLLPPPFFGSFPVDVTLGEAFTPAGFFEIGAINRQSRDRRERKNGLQTNARFGGRRVRDSLRYCRSRRRTSMSRPIEFPTLNDVAGLGEIWRVGARYAASCSDQAGVAPRRACAARRARVSSLVCRSSAVGLSGHATLNAGWKLASSDPARTTHHRAYARDGSTWISIQSARNDSQRAPGLIAALHRMIISAANEEGISGHALELSLRVSPMSPRRRATSSDPPRRRQRCFIQASNR